jgi:DNA-binding Lrp family transcriptional regulator
MDQLDLKLLNDFQRDFPLVCRPFQVLARACGSSEDEVLTRLTQLTARRIISRVGAVFAPGRMGTSTLGALRVPEHRLEEVAAAISALPEVNHNYAREHAYNLWFVASATDQAALDQVLARIKSETACALLDLPLIEEYRIDLGFDLTGARHKAAAPASTRTVRVLSDHERKLLHALQCGLALVAEPFRALAQGTDLTQAQVLAILDDWIAAGSIRRFGVIVRHHELGYRANCMAVWNVPDALVSQCGRLAACVPEVTLAYRRRRQLPAWGYNLFCMVHGKERRHVEDRVKAVTASAGLAGYPHELLFSTRRFKQTGARYVQREASNAHG